LATSGSEHIRSSRARVPSVWHRPQCNIGPGISPVTISTLEDSRKRPGSPGLASSTRRRRSINERSRRLDWEDHCEDLDERGPDCFRRQYRMPQQ
ncbi:unnamed protein product, partial [Ascophyllum nodosum]